MPRIFFAVLLSLTVLHGYSQQYSIALGVYGGVTIPYSLDKGMDQDPRYKSKYTVKAAPIGFNFSMDYENVGFQISPGLFTLGQDYYVVNNAGGQDGTRSIDLKYLLLPVSFKYHLIDLSFFRVSAVAVGTAGFLLSSSDKISHTYTKLRFPLAVYPILPAEYTPEYDGVISPPIDNMSLSESKDFKSIQAFAGLGLCADWNVTEHWRVNFDFRVNYGLIEPRTNEAIDQINTYQRLYDSPGKRVDTFAHLSLGISRFLDFDKKDRDREKGLKGNSKRFTPKKVKSRRR
jgi:hypothetical protein